MATADRPHASPRLLPIALLMGVTTLAVTVSYQVHRTVEIDMGSGPASAFFVESFHDAEDGYRWSRERSCVTFPDTGAGVTGRAELEVSAFRPRNLELPIVVVEAGSARRRVQLDRGLHTLSLPVTTRGWWSSDLPVCVRSETFQPGPMDQRRLGVRVHRARWVVDQVGLTVPALRQVVFSCLTVLLLWAILIRVGPRPALAFAGAATAAAGFAAAYVINRPFVAVLAFPLLALVGAAYLAIRLCPPLTSWIVSGAIVSGSSWVRGLRRVVGWPAPALAAAGAVLVAVAYLARPVVVFDLGSGRETSLADRFASFDSRSGVNFRRALQGAELDLSSFGGGALWRVRVTASLPGGEGRVLPVVRTQGAEIRASLSDEWTTGELVVEPAFGWDSGLRLEFPVNGLLIDRVEIDRGRSLPSVRIVAAVVGAALALAVALGAIGLERRGCFFAAAVLLLLESTAVYLDPVLSVPFASTFAGICVLGTGVAALGGGLLAAMRSRGWEDAEGPFVLGVVTVGFLVWLSAMSFPLYKGLHFVYHSNIAEEIWKGKFFVFYLPHPDNILSREAQWNGLVVPYSCLYHTIVAPLSALPGAWFQQLQKIFQAGLLTSMALAAALLARRLAGPGSSLWTAVLMISIPSTYQLLGLAHFLTVFGCWASTLAITYLVFTWGKLERAAYWWGGVGLLTLAFLSYTASLLFTGVTIAFALPAAAGANRRQAGRLLTCTLAATGAAFLLYYMHWVLPFVRESIPILLASGDAGPLPLWTRLTLIPRKLTYSFGSAWIPLVGLAGVGLVTARSRCDARFLLPAWAAVLVVFSGLDLFFNFILKHHYFTVVPIAVGCAALADLGMRRGGATRWLSAAALVYVVALGGRAALSLAVGTIK